MTMQAALQHERHSAEHARNVSEKDMWMPPRNNDLATWERGGSNSPPLTLEEMKRREHQSHVDHVWDMVPFWMKGIEAAESQGEVPSMEEFLESSDSWQSSGDIWGYAYSPGNWGGADEAGWGADVGPWNWGGESDKCDGSSMRTQKTRTAASGCSGRKGKVKAVKVEHDTAFSFVESIAVEQAANAEKKRLMHDFFEVITVLLLLLLLLVPFHSLIIFCSCPLKIKSRKSKKLFDIYEKCAKNYYFYYFMTSKFRQL
jgi:hypothetical protein